MQFFIPSLTTPQITILDSDLLVVLAEKVDIVFRYHYQSLPPDSAGNGLFDLKSHGDDGIVLFLLLCFVCFRSPALYVLSHDTT